MDKVLYDPLSLEAREDPYPIHRRLRAESPVYHNEDHDIWVLARFADVQAVARDWKTYSNARRVDLDGTNQEAFGTAETGNLLDSDPPVHTRLRGMVHELFTPKAIKSTFVPEIRSQVEGLLDRPNEDDAPDLAGDFADVLPAAVIAGWLGFPRSDVEKISDLMARFVACEVGNPAMPDGAVKRQVETASVPVVSLDLPLVWVTWRVPRGQLYRHQEDEDESACGGCRGNAIQH